MLVSGKLSTNACVNSICVAKSMASNGSFRSDMQFILRYFQFSGSGAVKRFLITTLVNQVSTANNKFQGSSS